MCQFDKDAFTLIRMLTCLCEHILKTFSQICTYVKSNRFWRYCKQNLVQKLIVMSYIFNTHEYLCMHIYIHIDINDYNYGYTYTYTFIFMKTLRYIQNIIGLYI